MNLVKTGARNKTAIMRTVDVFYAFPSVLLAVEISGALGAGIFNAMVALTIVFIPPIARVSESVTTQVRSLDFVEAARASGASSFTIIRVHILGNVLGPVLIYSTSLISVSAAGARSLGAIASRLALAEDLPAHARSAQMRMK